MPIQQTMIDVFCRSMRFKSGIVDDNSRAMALAATTPLVLAYRSCFFATVQLTYNELSN